MYSFRRTEGYDGRRVAAGSTPSNLISAKSSASTNTSITRTGLLSLMKSSRHSGNSVHCPRSASSTKRPMNVSQQSPENLTAAPRFHTARVIFGSRRAQPLRPLFTRLLFDHLICKRHQVRRHLKTDGLGGLQVDYERIARGLLK